MRQIVLDTETTGLHAHLGDRIVEIGCVELVHRRVSDRGYHRYLNPEREIEDGALKIHGITREFLADKPRFADIADEFLAYIAGAELLIHNAEFDVEFLDAELARIGREPLAHHVARIVDTLALARELHPGRKNSLDALCERYGVDHSHRHLHGAQLDARLLADVYLAMTRGQDSLEIAFEPAAEAADAGAVDAAALVVVRASAEEAAAHEAYLDALDRAAAAAGGSVWRRQQSPAPRP